LIPSGKTFLSTLFVFVSLALGSNHALADDAFENKVNAKVANMMGYFQDTTRKDSLSNIPVKPFASDRYGDPITNYFTPSPLYLKPPSLIDFKIDLDSTGNFYRLSEKFGPYDYRTLSKIPFDDYRQYRYQAMIRDYWRNISIAQDGDGLGGEEGSLLPPIKLGRLANRLFGGDQIEIETNGTAVLDFGWLYQRVDNPSIPVRQQRNGGFNFNQQISMKLSGKIGEKLSMNFDVDNQNAFQFEQRYNVNYTAFEEDIIQEVQVGNLSFPVSNTLITGSQNLFGVSTRMRFGKLWVNTVFSSQRGTTEQIIIRNGAQSREFEIRGHRYDFNRHFFLAQFFRDNFERSLLSLPAITSGVVVTRVEVYITNRNNNTETLRNLTAFQDLGEQNPHNANHPLMQPIVPGTPAGNRANGLMEALRNNASLRNPDQVNDLLERGQGFTKGEDYELLRGARKLDEREYTLNSQLGYISLLTPLRNDEILAVSFEYTFNGQVFKVGEMMEDYSSRDDAEVIYMKMLRPSTIRTDLPMWDLMMKNIYSLETNQVRQENFQLRVIYRDDLTGIDNPSLHEGQLTTNVPLVQIMKLDRLNPNNDPSPDGNFDYLEGITIDSQNGLVIFPVLEPFGSNFLRPAGRGPWFLENELPLINKYVFDELYRGTQADAMLNVTKDKFFIVGSFQSATSNEIILPGINIAPNSVVVRAGNTILTEGVDYSVDYQFGRVRINNEGVLTSGKEIRIQYERADLFNFQIRNLMGVDLEYHLNKNVRFTTTLLHLNERPIIRRVSIGQEPVSNTLWGFGMDYRSESRLLTKLVDKLPGVSTKEQSNVAFSAEFAQLIPGSPRLLGSEGVSYIDDFEGAEVPYDLGRNPVANWVLGSTPQQVLRRFPVGENQLEYNFKRARLSWYNIDNVFYFPGGGFRTRPSNITNEQLENHYVRLIPFNEVFPARQAEQINTPQISFDLAFYPSERGPYNYNPNLLPDGSLPNPRDNFGAITRAIKSDIDFDNLNIQYIEFWLLDPFITGRNGQVAGSNNNTGGFLYFNLGNVSEDLIPDGRHFFENGLRTDASTLPTTPWGRVPSAQFLQDAFDAGGGVRAAQDVGFDGLDNESEREFFRESFLDRLPNNLTPEARSAIEADPSADDFRFYLDNIYDDPRVDGDILDRYKLFNNYENNSPETAGGLDFPASSSNLPDNEDLNRDNTISDLEQYFQYRMELRPGRLENNRFVVDKVIAAAPETGELVNWYLVRIPLRDLNAERIGNIEDFKSIRFIRMFMTGWQQPTVLRMVNFQMVGAQWRPFLSDLSDGSLGLPSEPYDPNFTVTTVNIEENGPNATGVSDGSTPYVLPPGISRDFDATSTVTRQLNEQSLQICVEGLEDKDSRAVYKNFNLDFINYGRLKLEIHAESQDSRDGEMTAFIRLGTDFQENYYEIEVPLVFTPRGSIDPEIIWPRENQIDIPFAALFTVKSQRNLEGGNMTLPYPAGQELNVDGKYRVTVVGNPDLASVQTVMLGVRNPRSDDQLPRSTCIWFNELRATDWNSEAGWAVNASLGMQLADLATFNTSIRYNTFGFGGIQDKISNRSRTEALDFEVSSNVNLDKFYLDRLGISLPLFVSYERRSAKPLFDPLDPDVPLELALNTRRADDRDSYFQKVTDLYEARSINLTNVTKKKMNPDAKSNPWDIENLSLTATYADTRFRNITTAVREARNWRLGGAYAYTSQIQPLEPFSEMKAFQSPYLQLLRDINFNLVPSSIAVRGALERSYIKTQFRNANLGTDGLLPTFEKSFFFNRNYNLQWSLSKNLTMDYQSTANAIIDEPDGAINTEAKRDSVWNNLGTLGRMKQFNQGIGLTYRMPFDKFPLTTWVNADARYAADYNWVAGAIGLADTLGNTLRNGQTVAFNGKIDLEKVYNSVPFLKKINQGGNQNQRSRSRTQATAPVDDPLERKKERLLKKIDKAEEKLKKLEEKEKAKEEKRLEKEQKRLEKQKVEGGDGDEEAPDSGQPAPGPGTDEDPEEEPKPHRLELRKLKLQQKVQDVEDEQDRRKVNNYKPPELKIIKGVLKTAMSAKNINLTYTENNNTVLPGFLPTPRFLGFDSQWDSPGLPFILGSQDASIRERAALNGWLGASQFQNNPFMQNQTRQIAVRTDMEPVKDLKIQLEAKRMSNANYNEIFRFVPDSAGFVSQTPLRNGGYGISFFSLRTAFSRDNADNSSPIFQDFAAHREVIQRRLNEANPNGEYQLNAQDVLIPAFIAAYSGRNPEDVALNAFPRIPIPNWRITYSGLSRLPLFQELFKSVTLSHAYNSEYRIGNYTSSLLYGASSISLDLNETAIPLPFQEENGNLVPVFLMNQITISEQFAPFLGVNMRTQGNVTIKVDYKKARDMSLNMSNSQVTEMKNSDYTIDLGYTKAGMRLPFKVNGAYRTLKNDLTFRVAFTLRDTRTVQRKLDTEEEATITAGNVNIQFKPTLAYQIDKKASLQMYFDRGINDPRVSSSFRRTNTAFGVQLRYSLAQ
jgi:cell surface protein SprA